MNTPQPANSRKVRPALAWSCALAIIGCVAFVLFHSQPAPVVNNPTASIENLVRREGRLYRTNQTQPFTGLLIERYPTGALKARSMVKNGLLDGLSEGWHTNRQVAVHETFKAGVSDGVRTKWYENGKKLSESTIQNGEHNGTFRRWHENGQLAEEVEMKHGQPNGISTAYYPSGFLKARGRVENGKVVDQQFWNDGETRHVLASSHLKP